MHFKPYSLSLLIARRYVFSKKSTHLINLISFISASGIAVSTMALVIVLSVFNGFQDVVASLLTNFDPQLELMPKEGKAMPADDPVLTRIKQHKDILYTSECVQDQALAVYGKKQATIMLKGVDDNYPKISDIQNILYGRGSYTLHAGCLQYGIPGIQLAQRMGLDTRWEGFMRIYAPDKDVVDIPMDGTKGFVVDSIFSPGVVFDVQQSKYDNNYILTSISFARNVFGMQGMITSLQIKLRKNTDLNAVKKQLRKIAGPKYLIKDRYEQQEDTFNIMQVEKFIAYIFLTFILIIASCNIIGSISMLIIEKQKDIITLRNLGATNRQITNIFLYEGRIMSAMGAIIGIILGFILCLIQQTYGIITLGKNDGSFIVNAYPVSIHVTDIVMILITVTAVSWISAWYPVRHFSTKLLHQTSNRD